MNGASVTDRLYYTDSYLTRFDARMVHSSTDGLRVVLDRTAFYPASGGQPFDLGTLGGSPIVEVVDGDDHQVVHILGRPVAAPEVSGEIDWDRRFDHMQQHTGQHLLSAVFASLYDAQTVSFHMGAESCTIDLAIPALEPAQAQAAGHRANQILCENRPVTIEFEDASQAAGLRKPSERSGVLRIVSIADLDRSACGGTHVRATGEIGSILIRKLDRVRGNVRVEFVCGLRATTRARADFETLAHTARLFSSPLDEVPALVAAQLEKAQDADKARRRLSAELATLRGRELYSQTGPGPSGLRTLIRRVAAITEELRTEAQSFAAQPQAALLVLGEDPPSVLIAVSKDSGLNAGQWLKTALATAGGRGGGTPLLAQGSVPSKQVLETLAVAFTPAH